MPAPNNDNEPAPEMSPLKVALVPDATLTVAAPLSVIKREVLKPELSNRVPPLKNNWLPAPPRFTSAPTDTLPAFRYNPP